MFNAILSHEDFGEMILGTVVSFSHHFGKTGKLYAHINNVPFESEAVFVEYSQDGINIYFGDNVMLILENVE